MFFSCYFFLHSGNTSTFSTLCEQYASALARDELLKQYLVRIGQLYFGIPKPAQRPGGFSGIFGNLLQSLMEDVDDGVGEAGDNNATAAASQQAARTGVTSPAAHTTSTSRQLEADNDLD